MLVSCFISRRTCILNMRPWTSRASFSVYLASWTKCALVLHHAGTSTGLISARPSTFSWVLARRARD